MTNSLAMFVKYPTPGKVKTRLAASIGAKKAAEVYAAFLKQLAEEHRGKNYNFLLCTTHHDRADDLKQLLAVPDVLPLEGTNVGEMMHFCFKQLLQKNEKVVIIGSDLPDLKSETVQQAFDLLDTHDLVFGPAIDGGYYLIAMKKVHDVFAGIIWSTETVLAESLKRAETLNLSVGLLDKRRDIDTLEDLEVYEKENAVDRV